MELRDIEYFATVAEHRSIGRAAEKLGLSQPALSKSLRRLEESIHAKVVKRTPKGVELTAVGSALFAQVRRLRLTLDDITREAADLSHGRAGHLRVGIAPGVALHILPTACDALLKEAPKVPMKIAVGERGAGLNALRNGELDLAVYPMQMPRHKDLVEDYLYDEDFVVYGSANHPLAKRRQLTIADLAHQRWAVGATSAPLMERLSQALADSGMPPPDIAVETTYLPLRFHLIATSDLLTFGSKRSMRYAAARFPIRELRVSNLSYTRRIAVTYREEAYLSPAARRFIEILKATAKAIARDNR